MRAAGNPGPIPRPVPAPAGAQPPAHDGPGGQGPTREAMQEKMAHQFGFDSWEAFRAAAERRLGKAVVRRLERELARYPRAGS